MHGQNPVRHKEDRDDGELQVHEVFYTLQGEGPYSGRCATFVRLSGCNLRCWFCDTQWNDDTDPWCSPLQLVHEIDRVTPEHCHLLVLTGGEPMRQRLGPFLREFWKTGHERWWIQVETAGTLWQDELDDSRSWPQGQLKFVVSPKAGLDPKMKERADYFKYIIRHGDLTLPKWSTQREDQAIPVALPRPGAPVYLSPCDEEDPEKNRLNREAVRDLALKFGWIAGVQLHKLIGVP